MYIIVFLPSESPLPINNSDVIWDKPNFCTQDYTNAGWGFDRSFHLLSALSFGSTGSEISNLLCTHDYTNAGWGFDRSFHLLSALPFGSKTSRSYAHL